MGTQALGAFTGKEDRACGEGATVKSPHHGRPPR